MKFSRHPGIRLKITLAFSTVFTLLSMGLNLYSYHQIRQLIISDDNRYLLARAQSLLDKTEVSPVIIPLPDKKVSIKVFARHSDKRRTLLFQSPGPIQQIKLPARQGVSDTLNLRVAFIANSSDDNPAELMLAASGTQLQTTLRYLLLLLILSTMLCVLISGVVSFWLASVFLLQLQKIIVKTRSINAGQLSERVPVKESNDELQELAETINGMLQRIELALQQQQNFFASASHELKTPLAVMRAELELNLLEPSIKPGVKSLLHSQLDEIGRLQNVVEEFLIISQIQAGKLNLNRERFELTDLCLKVFLQLKLLASERMIKTELEFDQETDDFILYADKEKIRLVLINLLINAIKYSARNATIYCFVGRYSESREMIIRIENPVTATITDTSQLTKAFYRENILQGGAGVGLWLCREILEAHQGHISLESKGSLFTVIVRLPY